ncbi:MAG: type 4a pilus biogenesis protein PilO [Syntrophobacteraceae bacterium]|nr:type 4a pilus biogenesis protein PilO [Syntrophobacteraceae bacterium]
MKNIYAQFQEKISDLPAAHKALLFVGTLFFMGVVFYYLQFQSQLDTISQLDSQISSQQATLVSLKAAAARVKVLTKGISQSEQELNKLLTLLPDQKEIPGLLESVSRLGAYVGLENILFQPEPERLSEFYATIPVRLDLIGTFDDLGVFLDSVSKLDRILKVESLDLVRQTQAQTPLLKVTCEIVTYRFLKEPIVVKKTAAKRRR